MLPTSAYREMRRGSSRAQQLDVLEAKIVELNAELGSTRDR